jgi:hypothetical protein
MFNILSFDPDKVQVYQSTKGYIAVRKKSCEQEYVNFIRSKQHLEKYQPLIHNKTYGDLKIRTVPMESWDEKEKILSTLFCKGENLEKILREIHGDYRSVWIECIKNLFKKFQEIGFMWGDFAPRNIIWNSVENILWLVDFERTLVLRDCPIEQKLFNRYIRNYSREEFSCFLTINEQAVLFEGFLDENASAYIPIEYITSQRKIGLLRSLFGSKPSYSLHEVHEVEDIMVFVATPFFIGSAQFFPMDSLDIIGSKRGSHEYINAVLAIRNLDETSRFSELTRISRSL